MRKKRILAADTSPDMNYPEVSHGPSSLPNHACLPIVGQGGGIVEMPEGCKSQDQVNGNGMTNYYKVEDLAKVSGII